MGTELQKAGGQTQLEAAIDSQRTAIEKAAVRGWDVSKQLDILSQLAKNPKLAACPPETVLSCVLSIARRGLSLNPTQAHAHLIPRKGRCTWITGFQGDRHLLITLAGFQHVFAVVVRPNERFRPNYLTQQIEIHEPLYREDGSVIPPGPADQLIAVYAVGVYPDGSRVVPRILWRDEIEAIRDRALKRGEDGDFSPWKTDFAAMARKTAIKAFAKAIDLPEQAAEALEDGEAEDERREWDAMREPQALPKAKPYMLEPRKKAPEKPAPEPEPAPPDNGPDPWEAEAAADLARLL
jgi:recombination protein RecT